MFLLVRILAGTSSIAINHILLCVFLPTWAEFTSVLVSGLDSGESTTNSFLTSRNRKAVSFKPILLE